MPLLDITVEVKREKWEEIFTNEKMTSLGHLGTHFDGMNTIFDLSNCIRPGAIFDVTAVSGRDIETSDIASSYNVREGAFVIFYTGLLGNEGYGTKRYFTEHPQLSQSLIQFLLQKHVAMIGIDAAGIRRGTEHTPTDQMCADKGVFVVENLANLDKLNTTAAGKNFTVFTFPVKFEGMSGQPCRVVAEI